MTAGQNYCASCGAELDPVLDECIECGYEPDSAKSPVVAAVLSLLITGAGHVYAGEALRGLGWFLGSVVGAVLLVVVDPSLSTVAILFPVAAAVDAYAQTA